MPLTKKVRDLLVPINEYAVTSPDQTLREAVPALRKLYCEVENGRCTEAGHRNILVIDAAGKLVGIMDFRSILKILIPEIAGSFSERIASLEVSIAFAQADLPELDEARASFVARVLRNSETKVRDVMLTVKGTIEADADLMDALKLIYRNKISVVPVYDEGKVIGVLRESDLFLAVADILAES
jgi:CBS domain-containing protein